MFSVGTIEIRLGYLTGTFIRSIDM